MKTHTANGAVRAAIHELIRKLEGMNRQGGNRNLFRTLESVSGEPQTVRASEADIAGSRPQPGKRKLRTADCAPCTVTKKNEYKYINKYSKAEIVKIISSSG